MAKIVDLKGKVYKELSCEWLAEEILFRSRYFNKSFFLTLFQVEKMLRKTISDGKGFPEKIISASSGEVIKACWFLKEKEVARFIGTEKFFRGNKNKFGDLSMVFVIEN